MSDYFRTRCEAMGRMVINVNVVERLAYRICLEVGVYRAPLLQINQALAEARRQVVAGLPPWSSGITPDNVIRWIDEARQVFRLRNELVHGTQNLHQFDGDRWIPILESARTGEVREYDMLGELETLTLRAETLVRSSSELTQGLTMSRQRTQSEGVFDDGDRWFTDRYRRQIEKAPRRAHQCADGCAILAAAPPEE